MNLPVYVIEFGTPPLPQENPGGDAARGSINLARATANGGYRFCANALRDLGAYRRFLLSGASKRLTFGDP